MNLRPFGMRRTAGLAALLAAIGLSLATLAAVAGSTGLIPWCYYWCLYEVGDPGRGSEVGAQDDIVAWLDTGSSPTQGVILEGITSLGAGIQPGHGFRVDVDLPLDPSDGSVSRPAVWSGRQPGLTAPAYAIAFVVSWPEQDTWSLVIELLTSLEDPPGAPVSAVSRRLDFDHPIRDPAVNGETVVWSDARSGDYQLWTLEVGSDSEPRLLIEGEYLTEPQLSEDWLVWIDGTLLGGFVVGPASLKAQRRDGGPVITVDDGTESDFLSAVRLSGSRVMWTRSYNRLGKASLWLHDLDLGQGGELAGAQPDGTHDYPWGGYDLSDDLIVRALPAAPDEHFAGEILAYDAEAVTSFHNLASYLTAFHAARTVTAFAQPAVADSAIFWEDGHPFTGNQSVILGSRLFRSRIHLPVVANDADVR